MIHPPLISTRHIQGDSLGEGAYGIVYRGYDKLKKTNVAIKYLNIIGLYKFAYRELKILNHVRSNYCLNLIDAEINERDDKVISLWLIMPLMEYNLADMLKDLNFTFEGNIKIMYQILNGLQYLFDAGIIHRDLKPNNVGINKDYQIRILDFGQAREEDEDMTKNVQVVHYRAIEVLCGKNYSSAIDIWSAGCIFYELFAKKFLFKAKTDVAQINEIVKITGIPSDNPFEILENCRILAPKENQLQKHIWKDITNFVCQPSQQYGNAEGAENVIKLICSMLELIPQKRATPLHAMNCELFNQYRDLVKDYPKDDKAEPFLCDFHSENEVELQDKIKEEINRISE